MLTRFNFKDTGFKQIWIDLYKNNPYLFPFSSYEYNEQVYAYKKLKVNTYRQKDEFYVYYEMERPLAILPLTIKGKTIYLFGDNISGCDNLDLIYDADISDNNFTTLFSELAAEFPGKELRFYKINERSKLYRFLADHKENLKQKYNLILEEDRVCVKIDFPSDYDMYFSSLSRNCRSNLKKAYNKNAKTNADMNLKVVQGPIQDPNLLSSMMRVYAHRESERKNRKLDFFSFIKNRYFSVLSWNAEKMQSQYTFCLFLHHSLAAFMSGFQTNFGEIVFPRVAMNSAFSKFAPGKLMISESVKWLQIHSNLRGLDLSRGDERYKYEMGGTEHFNYRFFMNF